VFGFKPKNPEEHRYYLLPGMGKSNRRQRQRYLRWSIAFGLIIAAIVGTVIYFAQRPGPPIFK
jgi:Na+-driven multidrug efflux pump